MPRNLGNTSTAVRQQRREAPDSLDYFPTPPFATRALVEFLEQRLGRLGGLTAWEPAAGELHMVRPLSEAFASVRASDVFPYVDDLEQLDFTITGATEPLVDVVATNPPFVLAQEFIETALQVARVGVAMLVRSAFLEGQERLEEIFLRTPPTYVLQFSERVVMLKGRLVRRGTPDPANDGKPATSATAYSWLVWLRDATGAWSADTRLRWIAPAFVRLERPGDYPTTPVEVLPPPSDGLFGEGMAA